MLEPSQDTALSSSSPGLPQPCVRPISPPLVCRVVAGQGWNWAAGEGGEGAAPQDPPTRSPAQAGTETPLASEQIRQKLPCCHGWSSYFKLQVTPSLPNLASGLSLGAGQGKAFCPGAPARSRSSSEVSSAGKSGSYRRGGVLINNTSGPGFWGALNWCWDIV